MDKSVKPMLKTRLIIEVVGFPEEHINETTRLIAEKFGEGVKEIKVSKSAMREATKISIDPKKPAEEGKFFSGFVEIECDVLDIAALTGIVFDWMPASIEVVEPEMTLEKASDLNAVLNDLCARLHQYDSVIKVLKSQNVILQRELDKYKPADANPKDEKD